MILIINTADNEKVFIGLAGKGKLLIQKKFKAQYQQAEKLLVEINKLLIIKNSEPGALKGIAVVNGPGPFTALRLGVATANTLAWALNIPVAGIKSTDFSDIRDLIKISEKKVKKVPVGDVVEPLYGKGPNITLKK